MVKSKKHTIEIIACVILVVACIFVLVLDKYPELSWLKYIAVFLVGHILGVLSRKLPAKKAAPIPKYEETMRSWATLALCFFAPIPLLLILLAEAPSRDIFWWAAAVLLIVLTICEIGSLIVAIGAAIKGAKKNLEKGGTDDALDNTQNNL